MWRSHQQQSDSNLCQLNLNDSTLRREVWPSPGAASWPGTRAAVAGWPGQASHHHHQGDPQQGRQDDHRGPLHLRQGVVGGEAHQAGGSQGICHLVGDSFHPSHVYDHLGKVAFKSGLVITLKSTEAKSYPKCISNLQTVLELFLFKKSLLFCFSVSNLDFPKNLLSKQEKLISTFITGDQWPSSPPSRKTSWISL